MSSLPEMPAYTSKFARNLLRFSVSLFFPSFLCPFSKLAFFFYISISLHPPKCALCSCYIFFFSSPETDPDAGMPMPD
jgi:hypothetical protein